MEKFERKVAITGIGMSDVGRRLMRDPLGLTIDACLAAMEDAGLTRDEVDGLSTYPGSPRGLGGISGGGIFEVENVLRVKPHPTSGQRCQTRILFRFLSNWTKMARLDSHRAARCTSPEIKASLRELSYGQRMPHLG